MWRTSKGSTELHMRVRIENGELVEKEILCPRCGGGAGKFVECDGAPCAILACRQCGKDLAEFLTDAEMEKSLDEMWRGVQSYLCRVLTTRKAAHFVFRPR